MAKLWKQRKKYQTEGKLGSHNNHSHLDMPTQFAQRTLHAIIYSMFEAMNNITNVLLPKDLARFEKKINQTDTCWLWTGSILPSGYGQFTIVRALWLCHRLAYTMQHGIIPDNTQIRHIETCNNRACVRPDHLVGKKTEETKSEAMHAVLSPATGKRLRFLLKAINAGQPAGSKYIPVDQIINRLINIGSSLLIDGYGEKPCKVGQVVFLKEGEWVQNAP